MLKSSRLQVLALVFHIAYIPRIHVQFFLVLLFSHSSVASHAQISSDSWLFSNLRRRTAPHRTNTNRRPVSFARKPLEHVGQTPPYFSTSSGDKMLVSGSQVAYDSGYSAHLTRYSTVPLRMRLPKICSVSHARGHAQPSSQPTEASTHACRAQHSLARRSTRPCRRGRLARRCPRRLPQLRR